MVDEKKEYEQSMVAKLNASDELPFRVCQRCRGSGVLEDSGINWCHVHGRWECRECIREDVQGKVIRRFSDAGFKCYIIQFPLRTTTSQRFLVTCQVRLPITHPLARSMHGTPGTPPLIKSDALLTAYFRGHCIIEFNFLCKPQAIPLTEMEVELRKIARQLTNKALAERALTGK